MASESEPGRGSMPSATVLGANPLTKALEAGTAQEKILVEALIDLGKKITASSGSSESSMPWWPYTSTPARHSTPSTVRGWNPGTVGGQQISGAGGGAGGTSGIGHSIGSIISGGSSSPLFGGGGHSIGTRFGGPSGTPYGPNGGQTSIGGGGSGGGGGGGAGGSGGGGGGGGGSNMPPPYIPPAAGRLRTFMNNNNITLGTAVVGIGAGVASAAGSALNNFSARMMNTNYDQFGNLYVLRNGGYSGKTYGDASMQGYNDKLRAARFVASSPADLINGGAQLLANSNNQTFGQNLTNAGTSAFLSPGMGLGQTAANMQQEGTNRANVFASMMFGQGTRTPGGGQISEVQLANAALNATRGGRGMQGMTPDRLAQMLQQGGTLRTNLNTFASNAGLGPEAVESLANILTAQTAYQNKYGSTTDFESVVTAASQGDKAATAKLKGTGIGEGVEQSILNRQGATIDRDMSSGARYIDTLKETNRLLQSFNENITKLMKSTGLSGVLGALGGANSGTGGRVGGALKSGATGAVIGTFIEPGIGTAVGAGLGAAYGFITGGASNPIKSSSSSKQNPASPAATSSAANAAIAYALAQVGKPYVEGGKGPDSFDCSGLTMASYKAAGVSIPRVSSTQSQFGLAVPPDQIGPGDLIFPRGYDGKNGAPAGLPGHVVMALSGGPNIKIVEAGNPRTGVYVTDMNVGDVESARRVTGGVGTLAPSQNVSDTGASKTNIASSAGQSQTSKAGTASAPSSMNEKDVLSAILGAGGAFQGPALITSSLQKTGTPAINGSADTRYAYAKGAFNIDGDQVANVHDGEMILDSKLSRSVRAALMADIPRHTSSGGNITFAPGSIVVNVNGTMTSASARDAARQFVDAVAADDRIRLIGEGL